jgi:hypothetical protein
MSKKLTKKEEACKFEAIAKNEKKASKKSSEKEDKSAPKKQKKS